MIHYRITDSSGKEIFSTLSFPDEDPYVITGEKFSINNFYVLYYIGKEAECGQLGSIFIKKLKKNKMSLCLVPKSDMYSCFADQILPTKPIVLTKQ